MDKDTVLIILGVLLVLAGIAGRIESEHFNVGLKSNLSRILVGCLGAVFILLHFISLQNICRMFAKDEIVLEIPPFEVKTIGELPEYIAMKTEKNLIEMFVNSGLSVISNRTNSSQERDTNGWYILHGTVHQSSENTVSIEIELVDNEKRHIATTSINANGIVLKERYKVLPEVVIYGLEINKSNLKRFSRAKKPTNSLSAYMHYLWAKKKYRENKYDEAINALNDALIADPNFAMAYWTGSEILEEHGKIEESTEWAKQANKIDPEHPKWDYHSKDQITNPVPTILAGLSSAAEKIIEQGASILEKQFDDLNLSIMIIKFKSDSFNFKIFQQYSLYGNGIKEFINKEKSVFAINGGMYHSDHKQRLSPAGLFLVDGKVLQNKSDNLSGAFVVTISNRPLILPTSQLYNLGTYKFGIQSRPLLVDPGGKLGIYSNDYNRMDRSAVCIKGEKTIFVIVKGKNGAGLSLYEFAKILQSKSRDGGLECDIALNLDGGPSSQIAVNFDSYKTTLPGLWNIHNAILVFSIL